MKSITDEMMITLNEIRYGKTPVLGGIIIEGKTGGAALWTSRSAHVIGPVQAISITAEGKVCPMVVPEITIITRLSHTELSNRKAFLHVGDFTLKVSPDSPYNFSEILYFYGIGENACFKCIFYKPTSDIGTIGCSMDVGFINYDYHRVFNSIDADISILASGNKENLTDVLDLPDIKPAIIDNNQNDKEEATPNDAEKEIDNNETEIK